MLFKTVGADIVFEIMALFRHILNIKVKVILFTDTIEIMEDAQSFMSIQLFTLTAKGFEFTADIAVETIEVHSGLFHILLENSNCKILFLQNTVGIFDLIKQYGVELFAQDIKLVTLQRKFDYTFKVFSVQFFIVDGQLCHSLAVKTVQQFGIFAEHTFFVFFGCSLIVDIRKSEGF